MAGNDFAAQVRAMTEKCKQRQDAIFRASAARVMDEANVPEAQGGRMPVKDGFLRNSTTAATSPSGGGSDPALVFAKLEVGQTVYAGWTAEYAMRQEFGFVGEDSLGREYNQSGKAFLRTSLQRWQEYVDDAARDAEAKIR